MRTTSTRFPHLPVAERTDQHCGLERLEHGTRSFGSRPGDVFTGELTVGDIASSGGSPTCSAGPRVASHAALNPIRDYLPRDGDEAL